MLSAAGLSGGSPGNGKPKALSLAPPPSGAAKIRTPLPPPPNDAAAVRMTSPSHATALKGAKENSKHDTLSDLSQLEVCLTLFRYLIEYIFLARINSFRNLVLVSYL